MHAQDSGILNAGCGELVQRTRAADASSSLRARGDSACELSDADACKPGKLDDGSFAAASAAPRRRGRPAAQLRTWEEVPPVLQFNKYIRTGYRTGDTYVDAVRSMLAYHNETGNIWTHLMPALCLLVMLVNGLLRPWPAHATVFWMDLVAKMMCLFASASYHTCMMCHRHYSAWLKLDVCSIMAMSISGWSASVVWGLPCHSVLGRTLFVMYVGVGLFALTRIISAGSARERAAALGFLWLMRLVSMAARAATGHGSSIALTYFCIEQGLGVVGGVINATKVPERWVPHGAKSRFLDYWANSHQIMHVLGALGMLCGHWGIAADAEHMAAGPVCPAA